jgi:tRNA G18 (ribose-2'-O)-methylase SpoU
MSTLTIFATDIAKSDFPKNFSCLYWSVALAVAFLRLSLYHSSMRIVSVTSLDESDLQPYKTLRRPLEHERSGIFVAEGEKVVRRLLESTLDVSTILLTPEWLEQYRVVLEGRVGDLLVYVAPKNLMESIVGFHLHQGIMAVARIPNPIDLSEAIRQSKRPALLVAVEGLTNAENLGVLVRNCAAFGADALLVGEASSSPYLRRAVRNSMGTVFTLPVVHLTSLVGAINEMKSVHHIHVVAAHPHAEKRTLHAISLREDCCVVFGSEGEGIDPAVLAVCDDSVAIPMKNNVDSLNVASASAVFLFEVQRQRYNSGLRGEGR